MAVQVVRAQAVGDGGGAGMLVQPRAGMLVQPKAVTAAGGLAAEPLVVERLRTVVRYAANGTGSREITAVTRIQADAAAREYGVLTIPFAGADEAVQVQWVRVRHSDGTVTETPATDMMEMPAPVTQAAPFYSDLKVAQVPVRSLRAGDTLEYQVRVVRTRAETKEDGKAGAVFGALNFVTGVVVLEEQIELHFPASMRMKVRGPEEKKTVAEVGGERVYTWRHSQTQPTVGLSEEAKRAAKVAAGKTFDPEGTLSTVAWTSFGSWEEVGGWYRRMEGDRTKPDAAVTAKAKELTAGMDTEEEKVRAVYGYVSTQVRYVGVAFGVGRYQPHPAAEVLGNQYGDCKDKHTLLAAMLTAVGMRPSAVLIGVGMRMDEEVPSPGSFDHLITQVAVKNQAGMEEIAWLDATEEVAPYRMLFATLRDKRALVVPDAGAARLERTPAGMPFVPFTQFDAKGTLDAAGVFRSHMVYLSRGDEELALRAVMRSVPPGRWDEAVQQISRNLGFGGTTSHAEVTRPELTRDPWTMSYDYEREKTDDWKTFRIVPQMAAVFLPTVDEKDPPVVPIELGEPRVDTGISVLTLPDGWGAELPDAVHKRTGFAAFDKTYRMDGRVLTTERRIEVLQRKVPAAEWASYKKWTDAIDLGSETYVQLVSAPGAKADASGPPSAGANDAEAGGTVKEAFEAMQRGEMDRAREVLDSARKRNDKQEYLWSGYGDLESRRNDFEAALADYRKELQLHPEATRLYPAMAQAEIQMGRRKEAMEMMRKAHATTPDDTDVTSSLAEMEAYAGAYDAAATLLETVVAKRPDDAKLRVRMGVIELKGSRKAEGAEIVEARIGELLAKPGKDVETEARELNNLSYTLADNGEAFEVAERGARRATELLSQESVGRAEGQTSGTQPMMKLLVASWDTLGWTLLQSGAPEKTEEGIAYLRSAWRNTGAGTEALHLGKAEEKKGQKERALTVYRMGDRTLAETSSQAETPERRQERKDLQQRIEGLRARGVVESDRDPARDLQLLRTFPLGEQVLEAGKGVREYALVIGAGGIRRTVPDDALADLVRKADLTGLVPTGSGARLIRRGVLNCHTGTCDLVLLPW